jgi:hypothetical protein
MGVTQWAGFIGPTIAGIIIARFSDISSGVGTAFAFDAFTFVVSAVTIHRRFLCPRNATAINIIRLNG